MKRQFLAALMMFGVFASAPAVPQSSEVDLALVLAIDCSFSVDRGEYTLQMQGLGEALQSEEVWEAIEKGPKQRIALAAFHWSDIKNQQTILKWTIIDSAEEAQRVGKLMTRQARNLSEGGTATTAALLYGGGMFGAAPAATRRVIDLSTDGRNNMGAPLKNGRLALLAEGITINGLAIINEWPELDKYLEKQLIGGQGSFVERAATYDDFGSAMRRKLIREIVGPGLT